MPATIRMVSGKAVISRPAAERKSAKSSITRFAYEATNQDIEALFHILVKGVDPRPNRREADG